MCVELPSLVGCLMACSRNHKIAVEGYVVLEEFTKEICCILDAKADTARALTGMMFEADKMKDPEVTWSQSQNRKHGALLARCESSKQALLSSAKKAREDAAALVAAVREANPGNIDIVLPDENTEPVTPVAVRMSLTEFVTSPDQTELE